KITVAVPVPPTQVAASTVPADAKPKVSVAEPAKAGPGSFEVDEDAAQRALERTLVQTGALLLPFGQAEIQPYVTYARRELSQPFLFSNNQTVQVTNAAIRRNEFDVGANLLFGLPYESQLELRVPYRIVNSSVVTVDGFGSRETSNTGDSFGDINIGLAKTLIHESDWVPDLIARLTYHAPSGTAMNNNVVLGDGFNAFTVSMTALKRQDPLAFTANLAYHKTLKKQGVEPGDQIGFSLGATLAASPQTSLSLGLQQNYALESKVNGVKVQGSDNLSSVFTVGASSTIGQSLFFSVSGGIGLTSASPKYFINITIPFRFSIPI
ncbi:MAG: transporter, partial [Methylococcaceae bacterium]|nr:transporter [Methylococcaceae bacterium]